MRYLALSGPNLILSLCLSITQNAEKSWFLSSDYAGHNVYFKTDAKELCVRSWEMSMELGSGGHQKFEGSQRDEMALQLGLKSWVQFQILDERNLPGIFHVGWKEVQVWKQVLGCGGKSEEKLQQSQHEGRVCRKSLLDHRPLGLQMWGLFLHRACRMLAPALGYPATQILADVEKMWKPTCLAPSSSLGMFQMPAPTLHPTFHAAVDPYLLCQWVHPGSDGTPWIFATHLSVPVK